MIKQNKKKKAGKKKAKDYLEFENYEGEITENLEILTNFMKESPDKNNADS